MNDMKKNIRRVFWLYFLMFFMVVAYLGYFILVDSHRIVNSIYNPRINIIRSNVARGSIYDANGEVIAESVLEGEDYVRKYYSGSLFAHITGYSAVSKSGVEAKYNFDLQNLDSEIVQRVSNLVGGTQLKGDSVHLTVDSGLQRVAADGLGSNKGAAVAIEPSTGKVLAMVSYPSYDPNTIAENWDTLRQDNENSPLLNRAAQGLYPPGSTFKMVTAKAIMEHMEDWEDYYYECIGEFTHGDNRIRCYDSTAHGTINLHDAIKYSCNTYFANASLLLGEESLIQAAESLYFNTDYYFNLENVNSRFQLEQESTVSEVIETSIGQGRTVATPLHMAMIGASVANGGKMMEPYIVDHLSSNTGSSKNKAVPKMLTQAFTLDESELLTEMMVAAVEGGTGSPGAVYGIRVAGKTGTAQTSSGEDHGWFVAFAPADDPQIAVCVMTENSGGSRKAISIAKSMIEYYLNNN